MESLRRWWHAQGAAAYPRARGLLVTADAGGSNGYRTRAWKSELAALAAARWDALTAQIAVARHAQREAGLHQRRGGRRQAAAGTGRKAVLTLSDRIAITLLAQRFSLPGPALAGLFTVSTTTINNVIRQTQPLLAITGHHAEPAGTSSAA